MTLILPLIVFVQPSYALPVSSSGTNSVADQSATSGAVQNPQGNVGGGLQPTNPSLQPTSTANSGSINQTTLSQIDNGTQPLHVVTDNSSISGSTGSQVSTTNQTNNDWLLISSVVIFLVGCYLFIWYARLNAKQRVKSSTIGQDKEKQEVTIAAPKTSHKKTSTTKTKTKSKKRKSKKRY